ncbi:hypothetical protein [Lusitaniella coriacea]|uniref:hypothetical protein n=1 Tax=Lusitaniella coriacea TaxID=1983105 RepID=UPI003CEB04E8
MGFQLRKDARRWFRDIEKHYPTLFDLYYFCLVAGFASGQRNIDISNDEIDDFIEYFPGEFRSRGKLLVGTLIDTELRHLAINVEDRDEVYREVKKIVDPNSPSYLSSEGMKRMNAYAHGGFDVLCEHFSDRPRSIETFIRKYCKCISDLGE